MTAMTSELRPESVQPHFGQAQATRIGTLPTGLSFVINGSETVQDTYGQLHTNLERQAFFDEFLKAQRRGFPSAWVAIYETVDLIRQNDWYWKGQGFDSFDAFWQEQGAALFGRWAELESTYQYAHLAAPQLFEVQYEEAKALAMELAPFRQVPAAMDPHRNGKAGRPKKSADDRPPISPIEPTHWVKEMNSAEWNNGFQQGQRAKADGGNSRFARFARLRRDNPEVADRFLAGEFVKRFKDGTVQPDLVAAEIAAGIRKEGEKVQQADATAYCKKLASKLNTTQLQDLQAHITHLLEIKQCPSAKTTAAD
jgi:hypothetical protein